MTADFYRVPCLLGKTLSTKKIEVSVPGSKSITNRALLLAMLADGTSYLHGALFSDDSRYFMKCLNSLGIETLEKEDDCYMEVSGLHNAISTRTASLYVGSAGTAARFLTATLGISEGTYTMDASEQMKKRPMAPLISTLKELGCEFTFLEKENYFPFQMTAHGFQTNTLSINIEDSSQFLSALLIASALSKTDMNIKVIGTHGMSYVEITRKMMKQFGVETLLLEDGSYLIPAGQSYHALDYQIEPDVSAAGYFYGMAALLGISVTVKNVHADSMQGDIAFLHILEQMGCTLASTENGLCLTGPATHTLKGVTVDMSSCSDQAITLAAIAPFADSPVTITGIAHIRKQESDRISAILENLTAMGITCTELSDGITIYPKSPKPAIIKTHDDHRLAMGFSLTGLLAAGITIENPSCCKKTFETYFDTLDQTIKQLVP